MEKLLIRDRLDEETMGSVNSPDIIVVPSFWDDVGELQTNYNARLEAAVTASKWGYLFVRVKNNSGETLRNIYVTASFSNDPSDGRNKRESLQTVDGMASSFIPELSPGEWVVTEQPFVINRDENTKNIIYARACSEKAELPCNDGSLGESYVKFSVLKDSLLGKVQEGFLPIVNYSQIDLHMTIKAHIDVKLSESQHSDVTPVTTMYSKKLGIEEQSEGTQLGIQLDIPANCMDNLYYSILIPEETHDGNASENPVKQFVSVVFELSKEG